MATFIVTAPDGKEYEIDAPEGATQDQALEYFKANWQPAAEPATLSGKRPPAPQELTFAEKAALQANKVLTELGSVAPDFLPSRQNIVDFAAGATDLLRFNKPVPGASEKSAARTVGQFADPVAMALGGGAVSAAGKLLPKAKPLYQAMAGGAAAGGVIGGLSEEGDVLSGALTGAVAPAALAGAGAAVQGLSKVARNILDSVTTSGRIRAGHKMVLDQLPEAERAAVLSILQKQGVDTSPLGAPLTTAEAIASQRVGESPTGARLAALEEALSKVKGGESITQMRGGRAAAQQEIMGTLTGAAGFADDPLRGKSAADLGREAAKQARAATAKQLYPTGEVTGDDVLNEILSRPGVARATAIEGRSAANAPRATVAGQDIPASTQYKTVFTEWQQTPYKEDLPAVYAKYSIKSLQNQYRLMEKEANRLMKTGASTDELLATELTQAKNDLGEWLAAQSPEWAQANRIYAAQSQPITRMDVARKLEGKSPSQFLKATADEPSQQALIRKATGRPNLTFEDVFNLGQRSKIAALRGEAQISDQVDALRKIASADLTDEKVFQLPGFLNVYATLTNKLLRERGSATANEVAKAAADLLANPAALRKLLEESSRQAAPAASRGITGPAVGGLLSGMQNFSGGQ